MPGERFEQRAARFAAAIIDQNLIIFPEKSAVRTVRRVALALIAW